MRSANEFSRRLPEIIQFMNERIDNRSEGVLVHCFSGKGRSASIVVAYLMQKNSWTYETALKFVSSKRQISVGSFSEVLRNYTNSEHYIQSEKTNHVCHYLCSH